MPPPPSQWAYGGPLRNGRESILYDVVLFTSIKEVIFLPTFICLLANNSRSRRRTLMTLIDNKGLDYSGDPDHDASKPLQ